MDYCLGFRVPGVSGVSGFRRFRRFRGLGGLVEAERVEGLPGVPKPKTLHLKPKPLTPDLGFGVTSSPPTFQDTLIRFRIRDLGV